MWTKHKPETQVLFLEQEYMMVVESMVRNEIYDEMKHNYFYRLTKNNVTLSLGGETTELQSYGIEIERQDIENGSIVNIERDSVKSISPHRHKVHSLLKLLYDNCVSPVHLIEVLGDYIDEYIVDFDEALKETSTY